MIDFNSAGLQTDSGPLASWGNQPTTPFPETARNRLIEAGIDPGGELIAGKLTRATCSCKPTKQGRDGNGWYTYHADAPATLVWGCWNSECLNATGGTLTAKRETALSPAEQAAIKARIEADRKAREEERQQVEQATRTKAERLWKSGHDVSADHPYIAKKGIEPVGIRQTGDMLLIPMSVSGTGNPESLQLIFPDGSKKFLTGTGAIPGPLVHTIQGDDSKPLYICEGYATGCSISEATSASVVVSFSSGKLPVVATALRSRFPNREIIVSGDTGNGSSKATEAAKLVGCKAVFPVLPEGAGTDGSDFNDLAQISGLDEVSRQLQAAMLQKNEPLFDLSRLMTGADIFAGDFTTEWLWADLIPRHAISLFYARGGVGKSTLMNQIADAVVRGVPFMGLSTIKSPVVVIDYENPMSVLKSRMEAINRHSQVVYWTLTNEPPQLDKNEWESLKDLVRTLQNPLLIFDTLQSACSALDITSNKDFSVVMKRLKELRELGATVILLHHTPKSDNTKYIGASVIYNQVDHVLAMFPVKNSESDQESADESRDTPYRFGSKDKTRYGHHKIHVLFDREKKIFAETGHPDKTDIEIIKGVITDFAPINQTAILDNPSVATLVGNGPAKRILKAYEGVHWEVGKGLKNASIYRPISCFSVCGTLGAENRKTENDLTELAEKLDDDSTPQTRIETEFASFPEWAKITEKQNVQGQLLAASPEACFSPVNDSQFLASAGGNLPTFDV